MPKFNRRRFESKIDITASVVTSNSRSDIGSILKTKYGNTLSRDHIDKLDRSKLSSADKEILRKLKISLANKGRKPWNIGKSHRSDTIELIKKRTRQAMFRTDVRERWEAHWLPKTHTEETKGKLRSIMLQRERKKISGQAEWLRIEMGIDLATYNRFTNRLRDAYRRTFNLNLKLKLLELTEDKETFVISSWNVNNYIISLQTVKSEKRLDIKNRPKTINKKKERKRDQVIQIKPNERFIRDLNQRCIERKKKRKMKITSTILQKKTMLPVEEKLITKQVYSLFSKTLLLYRKVNEKYNLFESLLETEGFHKNKSYEVEREKMDYAKIVLKNIKLRIKGLSDSMIIISKSYK